MKMEVVFHKEDVQDSGIFSGYGNVFCVLDKSGDVVLPGAFSKSLASWKSRGMMPAMCSQHNYDSNPIGVWNDIAEDSHGLFVSGKISETSTGKDTLTLIKDGALNGLSIGFNLPKGGYEYGDHNGQRARLIKEIDLWEVSVVTFPANQESRIISVKSFKSKREHEHFLREAGYSRANAKRMASILDCDDQDDDITIAIKKIKMIVQQIKGD